MKCELSRFEVQGSHNVAILSLISWTAEDILTPDVMKDFEVQARVWLMI
jgi:hypothetical protein